MVNYITRKVRKISISHELITQFLIEGIGSIMPVDHVPKDLQIVDCHYDYRFIELYVCSDEFEEIKEGQQAIDWIITFKRNG